MYWGRTRREEGKGKANEPREERKKKQRKAKPRRKKMMCKNLTVLKIKWN